MEQYTIEKLSATIGVVQNGTLHIKNQQPTTTIVGTPSWYAWLETATTFRFESAEGTFTAHKERAGNRRGNRYWRAYRRKLGRLAHCYLGVSANLTLACLHEAARRLAVRTEHTSFNENKVPGQKQEQRSGQQIIPPLAGRVPIPILNTRLAPPRLPAQHIPRLHLLTSLEQGAQRPVMLISAPAGSGKTTLLAEWVATTPLAVIWLSCESTDNDLARFLSSLLTQLSRLNERLTHVDPAWYAHDYERVLTGPLNDLAHVLHQDTVLLLDDYHLITTDTIHAALLFLLEHLPVHLHLIIATRVDPPLPLARLRARNQLSELRLQELRFMAPEVEAFVRVMGLTLTDEALELLQARTEGWIAGIQLLALALRKHTDATAFLQTTGFTHHFLVDYVNDEVLAQQPVEMQRFLLYTCLLEQFTGPLCDAVMGEPGGQERLVIAQRANLFVSALDDTQTWYRYHPLFAEALRTRFHQLTPELMPEIYLRASHWYEQQHREEEACAYALRAGDQARAASLLEYLIPSLIEKGKFLPMRQWLSQLSPTLVADSPTLWLTSISLPMLRAGIPNVSPQTMALIIEQVEKQIQAHAQDGESAWTELQAGLPIIQAIAALAQDDPARAISLASEIPQALARSESALSRFMALGRNGLLGVAYGANGDLATTERLFFTGTPSVSRSAEHTRNLAFTASLSDLYEAYGLLRKLGQFYNDLFQNVAQETIPTSPILSTLMQARHALLLYEWDRLTEAEQAIQQSEQMARLLDATGPMVPLVFLLNCWTRVRIARARGEPKEIEPLLESIGFNGTWLQAIEQKQRLLTPLRTRLALTCNQLEPVRLWKEMGGLRLDRSQTPQATISGGYFEAITSARVLLTQGRSQHDSLRLSQAIFLLDHLRDLAIEHGWQGRLREIEVLLALTLQAQNKTKRALTILGSTLAQAEPEGYIRLFADEGSPMAYLLATVAAYTTASAGYIQQIQAALEPTLASPTGQDHLAARQLLPDVLSPRELEVLQLVARGFSNQQIADHLVISLNTAKRHITHLLEKLVVTNRTQALARARELHLL